MKINSSHLAKLREQEKLAKANQAAVEVAVADYLIEIENEYGFPIKLESLAGKASPGSIRTAAVWGQPNRQGGHSIAVGRHKPWLLPHRLAQAVAIIEIECQADRAGKRRTHCLPGTQFRRLLDRYVPARKDNQGLLQELFILSYSLPAELAVDAGLQARFPDLRPAQFVNQHRLEDECAENLGSLATLDVSPELWLALESLYAARALFVDRMLGSTIEHFARFRGSPAAARAEKMYAAVEAYVSGKPKPGDHYSLIDRFAGIAGLDGLHAWDKRPLFELNELIHAQTGSNGTPPASSSPAGHSLE